MYSRIIVDPPTEEIKEDMKLSVYLYFYKAKFGILKYTSKMSIEQTLNSYNPYHKENKNPINLMEEDLAWIKN